MRGLSDPSNSAFKRYPVESSFFFFLMNRPPPRSPLFPNTPLFRSKIEKSGDGAKVPNENDDTPPRRTNDENAQRPGAGGAGALPPTGGPGGRSAFPAMADGMSM